MGKGLSKLQRDLIAFTDQRRRANGLPPVAWSVTAEKALPPDLAEIITDTGRAIYDHFRKIFKPNVKDILETINDYPTNELYAEIWRGVELVLLKTAYKEYILSEYRDWQVLANIKNEELSPKASASEIFYWLASIIIKAIISKDHIDESMLFHHIADHNGNLVIIVTMPVRFLSYQSANEYASKWRERVPLLDWSVRNATSDNYRHKWHTTIAEAMSALYGDNLTEAETNRARAAITRSVARLEERGMMLRNAHWQKRAYDGAAFALTYDGLASLVITEDQEPRQGKLTGKARGEED